MVVSAYGGMCEDVCVDVDVRENVWFVNVVVAVFVRGFCCRCCRC